MRKKAIAVFFLDNAFTAALAKAFQYFFINLLNFKPIFYIDYN